MADFTSYSNVIFDFDGVIVNSNFIKKSIFLDLCSTYLGDYYLSRFDSFIESGPMTRFQILSHLYDQINSTYPSSDVSIEFLLDVFAKQCKYALSRAQSIGCLHRLKNLSPSSRWFILTAAPYLDTYDFLCTRNMSQFFDGGIYGSPSSKYENYLKLSERFMPGPTLLLGDSLSDFEVATHFKLDFFFVSNWSLTPEFSSYFRALNVPFIRSLDDLLDDRVF